MNYTRKQIITWVESQTKYKFQQLRNGVFFCRMLTIKFPEQTGRFKYNPAPISEYEYTSNLNMMKKLLTRKGLQQNLNVSQILSSKNNYELAKWFKALIDNYIPVVQNVTQDNFSSVNLESRPTLFSHKRESQKVKFEIETPRQRLNDSVDDKRKLQSAERAERQKNLDSKSKAKRLSMAKSDNYFFKEKKPIRAELKIPINIDRGVKKEVLQVQLFDTQIINQTLSQTNDKEESIKVLLYERALEESIQSFRKILERVKEANSSTQHTDYGEFKDSILSKIFKK